jgi:hypothetical protein
MNHDYNNHNQIWPGDWMGNDIRPSEDNLIIMDRKERLKYFNGNPRHLKKKSKVESVIKYLWNLVKL